jgi:hypothetical protein
MDCSPVSLPEGGVTNYGETRWIESESIDSARHNDINFNGDNNREKEDPIVDDFSDLFADPDPKTLFQYEYTVQRDEADDHNDGSDSTAVTTAGRTIRIQLRGYKAELGQTLHSTGLTIWRASNILCRYMIEHHTALIGTTLLEVR